MTQSAQNELVGDVAHDLVAQIAPQELPLFRPIKEAYFKDPEKTLHGQSAKDEMLGFGVAETTVMLITPVVLSVVTDVVKYIGEQILQTIKQESATLTTEALKKLFKKFRKPAEDNKVLLLSEAQISGIRQLAIEQAIKLKLPAAKANKLADAIMESLTATNSH